MKKQRLIVLISTILIVIADQVTKLIALALSGGVETNECFFEIKGLIGFRYLENKGAAFGMFADHRWIFMTLTSIALIVLICAIMFKKLNSNLLVWSFSMIIGGGIGNMIDRVFRGYVVDFIDVQFVDFYVFNIADCFVVIGCGLLILYLVADILKDRKKEKVNE